MAGALYAQASGLRGSLHPCKLGGGAARLPSGAEESHALGMLAAIFKFVFYCLHVCAVGVGQPPLAHVGVAGQLCGVSCPLSPSLSPRDPTQLARLVQLVLLCAEPSVGGPTSYPLIQMSRLILIVRLARAGASEIRLGLVCGG